MLDAIIESVKGQVINAVKDKTGLGPQEAEKTVPLAQDAISEGITSALAGGNLGGILDMVKGAGAGSSTGGGLLQNAVFQGIAGKFIHKLTGQLGLSEGMAQKVSGLVLPLVLSKLAGKTQEAGDTDAIDKGSLLDVLGLDPGDMLGNLAGNFLGGKKKDGGGGGGFGNLFN